MRQSPIKYFDVVFQEDEEGYIATVPALPGCHTQGKTIQQTSRRIKEAIEVYLESLQAHREHLPYKEQRVFLGSVVING